MKIIGIIMEGCYGPDGKLMDHVHSKRMVSVDLDDESERGDVQSFFDVDAGVDRWGLGTEEQGWWRIVDAFEFIEPNEDVHENKYPVAYHLTEQQFSELVSEANK